MCPDPKIHCISANKTARILICSVFYNRACTLIQNLHSLFLLFTLDQYVVICLGMCMHPINAHPSHMCKAILECAACMINYI